MDMEYTTKEKRGGGGMQAAEDKRSCDGMDAALGERQITVDGCEAYER